MFRLTEIVVGSDEAVRVGTHPLAAAPAVDGDELGVATVRRRWRSQFLRTQRSARVSAVLTRAQLTAVRLKLLPIFVRLSENHARLGVTSCAIVKIVS